MSVKDIYKQNNIRVVRRTRTLYGWRYGVFIGLITSALGLALYPIAVKPYQDASEWRKIQTQTRDEMGVAREDRQPGGMKVWQDPFERK